MKINSMVTNFVQGAAINYFPKVLKGIMKEYLGNVDFKDAIQWIEQDKLLYDEFPDNYKATLLQYGPQLGDLEWLNAEWLIDAGRESNPALASLFMSWEEAGTWLERQMEHIKNQMNPERTKSNDTGV